MKKNAKFFIYSASVAGPSHKQANIPCQDSCAIVRTGKYMILAVADGVGSMKYSDQGSKLAANVSIQYCSHKLCDDMSETEILDLLKDSVSAARQSIAEKAKEDGNPIIEYETTLTIALYDGKQLYYAQIGDSGMVALTKDGIFRKVTSQHRDEYGRVYSISFADEKLETGRFSEAVSSVVLATDGIFDNLAPGILKGTESEVDACWAMIFMNHFPKTADDMKHMNAHQFSDEAKEWLEELSEEVIDDDKTFICAMSVQQAPKEIICDFDHYKRVLERVNKAPNQANEKGQTEPEISNEKDKSNEEESTGERDFDAEDDASLNADGVDCRINWNMTLPEISESLRMRRMKKGLGMASNAKKFSTTKKNSSYDHTEVTL